MLTRHQLTHLAFNHLDTAEDRLRTLTALGVLDRFRFRSGHPLVEYARARGIGS